MTAEMSHTPERSPEEDARILTAFLMQQTVEPTPQNPDAATVAAHRAIANHLANPTFRSDIEIAMDIYRDVPPIAMANRIFKAVTAIAMPDNLSDPAALQAIAHRTDHRQWASTLDQISDDPATNERFLLYLGKPIASNISRRGKLVKATALLHGIEELDIVEMGCSMQLILKRLALQKHDPFMAFDWTSVRERPPRGKLKSSGYPDELSQNFNRLLQASEFTLRRGIGVDILDPEDEATKRWEMSCSRYLGELLVPALNERFYQLIEADVPQVEFVRADASTLTPDMIGGRQKAALLSTVIYQLPRNEVAQMLHAAENCTTEDGLIMVQDKVSFGKKLQVYKSWDWHYFMWVKDKARPDLGWQKYFSADGGRVKEVVVEAAAKSAPLAEVYGLND